MRGLAELLADDGWAVVCPDIPSLLPRRSMHDPRWLTEVALTLGRAVDAGVPQARGVVGDGFWSFVGHSAGAAVVVHAAACIDARHPGPEGAGALVLLDPVDTVGSLLAQALPGIDPRRPRRVFACRPSRCNRHGATVEELRRVGWPVSDDLDLAHPDPERIPGVLRAQDVPAASPWLVRICGAPGSPDHVLGLGSGVRDALHAADTL
jgi:pimeloyl-ACP methyl ester carboxylesterase